MELRRELILYLIESNGKPHDRFWLDIADTYRIGEGLPSERRADRARKYWQWYSNNGRFPDVLIPEDVGNMPANGTAKTKEEVKELITKAPSHPYDGLMLRGAWEAQGPDGVILLHSYRNNITGEDIENFQNDFVDKIRKSIREEVKSPVQYNVKKENELGLFVYSADKHIGAYTPSQSLYENEYNREIIYERSARLINSLLEEVDRFGTIDTLCYVDLGDALDGKDGNTTRGGHKLDQNMDNYEQYDFYFQLHKEFFDTVISQGIAENINFIGMSNANHDGLGFGYAAMRAVEIYLNTKYPNVNTAISRNFIDHFVYGRHNFMLCHGKDEQYMGKALPKILDPRAEAFVNNYMDYHRLAGTGPVSDDRQFNHFIKGDLHQSSTEYAKRFRYRNVSSFYGASAYISANFGYNFPAVDYEIVDKNSSKIYETRLFL